MPACSGGPRYAVLCTILFPLITCLAFCRTRSILSNRISHRYIPVAGCWRTSPESNEVYTSIYWQISPFPPFARRWNRNTLCTLQKGSRSGFDFYLRNASLLPVGGRSCVANLVKTLPWFCGRITRFLDQCTRHWWADPRVWLTEVFILPTAARRQLDRTHTAAGNLYCQENCEFAICDERSNCWQWKQFLV